MTIITILLVGQAVAFITGAGLAAYFWLRSRAERRRALEAAVDQVRRDLA